MRQLKAKREKKKKKFEQDLETDSDTPTRRLLGTILLLSSRLGQLILLGEFTGQDTEIFDESLRGVDDSLAGGNDSIGLDAQLKVGGQRVRDLAAGVNIS